MPDIITREWWAMLLALTIPTSTPVNIELNALEESKLNGVHAWTSSTVFILDMAVDKQPSSTTSCAIMDTYAGHIVGKTTWNCLNWWTQSRHRSWRKVCASQLGIVISYCSLPALIYHICHLLKQPANRVCPRGDGLSTHTISLLPRSNQDFCKY